MSTTFSRSFRFFFFDAEIRHSFLLYDKVYDLARNNDLLYDLLALDACCTFSSAIAVSIAVCLSASAASLMVHFSLPFTCTASSTVLSTVLASS